MSKPINIKIFRIGQNKVVNRSEVELSTDPEMDASEIAAMFDFILSQIILALPNDEAIVIGEHVEFAGLTSVKNVQIVSPDEQTPQGSA